MVQKYVPKFDMERLEACVVLMCFLLQCTIRITDNPGTIGLRSWKLCQRRSQRLMRLYLNSHRRIWSSEYTETSGFLPILRHTSLTSLQLGTSMTPTSCAGRSDSKGRELGEKALMLAIMFRSHRMERASWVSGHTDMT